MIFKLNRIYNLYFEQRIARSILAVGGLNASFMSRKLKSWLKNRKGGLLEVGSGDNKWQKMMGNNLSYISLDYVPAAVSCPWLTSRPDINGDGHYLPLKNDSIDVILNVAVIEHVKDPRKMLGEIARVLKPGGYLIFSGPGDITLSHGEPDFYFNISIYAYRLMLRENNLEIIEEYFPVKTFVSIFQLIYLKIVRHDVYNSGQVFKALQIPVLFISFLFSPFVNILGLLLDWIVPFDKRGYATCMILARKKNSLLPEGETRQLEERK